MDIYFKELWLVLDNKDNFRLFINKPEKGKVGEIKKRFKSCSIVNSVINGNNLSEEDEVWYNYYFDDLRFYSQFTLGMIISKDKLNPEMISNFNFNSEPKKLI